MGSPDLDYLLASKPTPVQRLLLQSQELPNLDLCLPSSVECFCSAGTHALLSDLCLGNWPQAES